MVGKGINDRGFTYRDSSIDIHCLVFVCLGKEEVMISNGKKAVVHIAKTQLGLTEEEYRRELENEAGVSSSVDLTDRTFSKVMRRFSALGYVADQRDYRAIENLPENDRRVMSKINAIRLDMGKKWTWVDGIARQAFDVESVMWVKGEDLRKVLSMVIYHQRRRGKRA